MSEWWDLAIASEKLRTGEVSSVELTTQCLHRIERLNPTLNAFITVTAEEALAQAQRADARLRAGRRAGPLDGIPVALKDLIDTAGTLTTAASAVYEDRVPLADAAVVSRLKAAGAVLLGKLNLHEFAYGGTCVPSHSGPVRNPWNPQRIAGGSSGGSGAAVAAGLCYAALGTDTAASVRHPAAYCGVTGLKGTYGLVSTRGVVPLSWSLDHVGPLARSALDAALVLEVLAGEDPADPAVCPPPLEPYATIAAMPTPRLRLGRVEDPYFTGLDPGIGEAVSTAIDVLLGFSAGVRSAEIPYNNLLMVIASAEAYAYHESLLRTQAHKYQPMTRERLEHAARITAADYIRARRALESLRAGTDALFEEVDLLVTPTTALSPIPITEGDRDPPLPANGTPIEFRNTHMFDVLGLPAISIPCGLTPDGMPVGLQLAGPRGSEGRLLAVAHAYQQRTHWHTLRPPGL